MKNHSKFQVEVFSQIAGKFVPHFSNAIHTTFESAKNLVKSFKVAKWQISGFDKYHEQWHVVAAGKPVEA